MMVLSVAELATLRQAMTAHVDAGRLPGLVFLVAQGDHVEIDAIGTYAFGGNEPMRRDTVFRIASLTKPIVGVAAMMLVEDGVLTLDAPVERWLPELANRRVLRSVDAALDDTVPANRPITVEDVLSYRMGWGIIEEPSFNPPFPVIKAAEELRLTMSEPDPRTPHDPDEWIKLFGTLPLMFQPGERWLYNASGLVLGVLVARASGATLPDFLDERIFAPLGMTRTAFWTDAPMPAEYMTDFTTGQLGPYPGSPAEAWTRPPAFPSASAGLVSTVDDYYAFARMLSNGGRDESGDALISPESISLMTANRLTEDQIARGGMILGGRGWGLGLSAAVRSDEVSQTPGRYGWEGGSGTSWFNDPASGVTAILLTQTSDVLFNGTLNEFGRLAINAASD
jgi:CubicO group peptidase (beta-lactamase class C family)